MITARELLSGSVTQRTVLERAAAKRAAKQGTYRSIMTADRVFILGAGRAGTQLPARALWTACEVTGNSRRTCQRGRRDHGRTSASSLGTATCVLVTVRDAQLEEALATLATAAIASGAVVLPQAAAWIR